MNNNINFELKNYLKELYIDIDASYYADEDNASKEDKFTEYVLEVLTDAQETDAARVASFIEEDIKEKVTCKLNGYAFDENYETVDLFITSYIHTDNHYTISTKATLEKIINQAKSFFNRSFKSGPNFLDPSNPAHEAAEVIFEKRNTFVRANIYVLTNAQVLSDTPKIELKKNSDVQLNIHVWDIERLNRLHRSKYNTEPIEIDLKNDFDTTIECLQMPTANDKYDCYLAIIPGELLADLYQIYGTRLLESNVRAFLQQTGKVNKGIKSTIIDDPDMFLPYNNGLATTALNIKIDATSGVPRIERLTDFQIVNGGQTTASLYYTRRNFGKKNNVDLKKVFVQTKITVIRDEVEKHDKVPLISRYANSQNKVTEIDLTSNNPFLQHIENHSRRTFAIDPHDKSKQTIWFFERVKGQYKEARNKEFTPARQKAFDTKYPKQQLVSKSDLSKFMNIWNREPYNVSKGAQKNYTEFMKIVKKEYKGKVPTVAYYHDLIANAILFKSTDNLFGNKRKGNNIGDTNIKALTVAYTLSYFHELTKNKLNLSKIWDDQTIDENLTNVLFTLLKHTYNFFENTTTGLKSEYAKKISAWEDLKNTNYQLDFERIKYYLVNQDTTPRFANEEEGGAMEVTLDLEKVKNVGIQYWDGLWNWIKTESQVLTTREKVMVQQIRKKLIQNKPLSEREINYGVDILSKLESLNLEVDKMKKLSTIKEEENKYNVSEIYNRLKLITRDDWDRITLLSEQSGKLDPKDLAISKKVFIKIRRNEPLLTNEYDSMNTFLEVGNKFGINV
ncbi:AIPR family protein [Flammeovirga yaeyamensis]|uniref:AIPR family protein n=1 Tax=Flammeovirga yaeyamensis TaxID=367791 RepID=A0AAX1MYZ3_9BACT|nr:AIPR family protein [Flammeovirga yaeyamensis]MBB3695928.1 hypothetical protein [Flammeovirga yaeyamensis]NMF34616.1 AIPR family protein [Flammeovirga yaeyamensis]QWG00554.1 AIPR family protein [Flammeovirga yaeyamensis]